MAVMRHNSALAKRSRGALAAAVADAPVPEKLRIAREQLAAHDAVTPFMPSCALAKHNRELKVLRMRMEYEENQLRKAVAARLAAEKKAAFAGHKCGAGA